MIKKIIALTLCLFVSTEAYAQCGGASWYNLRSRTASGEMLDARKLTAAHKTLKFGTHVKVTNQRNGKAVLVRINDRGPFIKGRIIDLSKAAAKQIGIISSGHGKVCIELASSTKKKK